MISGIRKIFHGLVGTLKCEIRNQDIFKIILAGKIIPLFYQWYTLDSLLLFVYNVLPVLRLLFKGNNVLQCLPVLPKIYKEYQRNNHSNECNTKDYRDNKGTKEGRNTRITKDLRT